MGPPHTEDFGEPSFLSSYMGDERVTDSSWKAWAQWERQKRALGQTSWTEGRPPFFRGIFSALWITLEALESPWVHRPEAGAGDAASRVTGVAGRHRARIESTLRSSSKATESMGPRHRPLQVLE